MSFAPEVTAQVQELLTDLDLFRLPVVPKQVCRRLGIEYREYRYEGIEGTLLVTGNRQLIGVNSSTRESSRRAFTCAHEIGHYYYDLGDGETSFSCSSADIQDQNSKDPRELRANEFAAELLMPRALVEPWILRYAPSWKTVSYLSERCGASLQAAAQRFVQLTPHTCWFAILQDGRIQWYVKQKKTEYHLSPRSTLIEPHEESTRWSGIPAERWMGAGAHTRGRWVLHSFRPRNQYGETLALLWDRKGGLTGPVQFAKRKGWRRRRRRTWADTILGLVMIVVCLSLLGKICSNPAKKTPPHRHSMTKKIIENERPR